MAKSKNNPSFLQSIIKSSGNAFASVVEDGLPASDVKDYIDTGSYSFNALLSGDIHGGIPDNKIIGIEGDPSTGKTFFCLGIAAAFLAKNPKALVFYFDSEQALTSEIIIARGLDPARVAVLPVATIEDFRHQSVLMVDSYLETPEAERPPVLMVLDSLGNLSSRKEIADTAEGKDTRDMTKAQVIKAAFRVLTIKLGIAHIPLLVTNHLYSVIGAYVPTKAASGGTGLLYNASIIVRLTKKKDKDSENDIVGNIIKCTLQKSRQTKEFKAVEVQLNYDTGLNRYYGLTELGIDHGIIKADGNKLLFPNGKKSYPKTVNRNPEDHFTPEVLEALNGAAAKEFKYQGNTEDAGEEDDVSSIE